MKFSLACLKEHIDTEESPQELGRILDTGGIEVEELVVPTVPSSKGFEVGEIVTATAIPKTKLQLCEVKSKSGVHKIVCGAPNARKGLKSVLATMGAKLPPPSKPSGGDANKASGGDAGNGTQPTKPTEGITITKRTIQGTPSEGMLCSGAELGLGEDSSGIIELPSHTALTASPFDALLDAHTSFEVAITPNRGDCASVFGIAREIAAGGGGKLKLPRLAKIADSAPSVPFSIALGSPNCSFFGVVLIKGITNLKSPLSLQQKLEQMGIGSINAAVDITNYFAVAYGRPLHCYDADKLKGLEVTEGSGSVDALNGNRYQVKDVTLVKTGGGQIAALAGVIGGAKTAVSDATKNIALECAMFDKSAVARASRSLHLHTESSYRFERGVDHSEALPMLHSAALEITRHCGGVAHSPVYEGKASIPPKRMKLDPKLFERLSGSSLKPAVLIQTLQKSGFKAKADATGAKTIINVEIPSYRYDVTDPAVLVSEVLRLRGFDAIESKPFIRSAKKPSSYLRREQIAKRTLAHRSLQEIVTWSFVPSLFATKANVELANPINKEQMAFLRSNLVYNLLAEQKADGMFELGPVWHKQGEGKQGKTDGGKGEGGQISEERHLASIRLGNHKTLGNHKNLLYQAKADITHCLRVLGASGLELTRTKRSLYHPGLAGEFRQQGKAVAYFGMVHPKLQRTAGLDIPVFTAEILLDRLSLTHQTPAFVPHKFQPIERDFAFIVPEQTPASSLTDALLEGDELVTKASVFDVYRGKPLEQGEKSLALKVTIQPKTKTLTSDEIDQISQRLVAVAASTLKAKLRSE